MRQVVFVLVVFSLFSCTNNFLFKADKEIKDGWHADSIIVFQFNISDTTNVFYSEINIRHTISYPFQNLFVFIHNTNPLGQTTTDTVECVLANKMGKWNAKGMGDILDFTQIYKDSIVFKTKGNYKIKIEQAMRYGEHPSIQSLSEIASVGVCIKRKGN
jgi:gliding motility-associated lipoprotein GldH